MSSLAFQYLQRIDEILERIAETQQERIEQAASIIEDEIRQGKIIYVFGTGGHDNRAAEELLWRAGGLAAFSVILDPGMALIHGATKATKIERLHGYAKGVLDHYQVGKGDTLLLINSYGINALTIDTVHECRNRGAKLIAITSFEFPRSVPADHPARHSSKENLHEIVEIAINSFVPPGDAVVDIEGFPHKVAAISSIVNVFVVNVLVCEVVRRLVQAGVQPPVWISANAPGGDVWNKKLLEQYLSKVRHL
ncbi:MAG TPA: sugar isomerase domain-containing protein [Candidatus Acidoferrum sp.]|nr:sugar isomerase domain-containing protein [Candidatus Acidoferrum sp.]